jgi:hypothetical protein
MRITIFFLLIGILSFSCSKKEGEVVPDIPTTIFEKGEQNNGWVTAQKNGLDYNASPFGGQQWGHDDFLFIYFDTYSEEGFLRGQLFFSQIPYKLGKMTVKGPPANNFNGNVGTGYYGVIGHGDEHDTTYNIDESADNTFEITYIDTVEQIIRGTFDVTYIIDEKYTPSVDPPKIHFSGGEFEVKLTL